MSEFLQFFLPVYTVVFFVSVFFLRTFVVWQRTGINAYVLLRQGGPQGVIGRYFKILPLLSTLVIVLFAFFPSSYSVLVPIDWLSLRVVEIAGLVLLVGTLGWIIVAQVQMGNSWRIGIDENARTELVINGVFALSRNPIFLGMKLNSLGFFLVLPNTITLLVLALGWALIDVQVAMEEAYLKAAHDEKYQAYCNAVRRWI